jgi:LPXTG-motif cell wall-anchored protein
MNVLSTLITTLAADAPAPKKENVEPSTPFFGSEGYISWWQLILIFVLIGLVGFFFYYRKKQQEE